MVGKGRECKERECMDRSGECKPARVSNGKQAMRYSVVYPSYYMEEIASREREVERGQNERKREGGIEDGWRRTTTSGSMDSE